MKKFLLAITLLSLLAGCSNEKPVTTKSEDPKMKLLVQDNNRLHDLLEERPNLSNDQLRETMNLSLKTIHAMVNKDYQYLESISDMGVTINKDTNSFNFEGGHTQNFLHSIDHNLFEYRFHQKEEDIITVGFAENNAEIVFQFIQIENTMKLHSFITN